jgi:hypothetical protein
VASAPVPDVVVSSLIYRVGSRVSGGVVSGLGKGITISSIGVLLKAHGVSVTVVKIDPDLVRPFNLLLAGLACSVCVCPELTCRATPAAAHPNSDWCAEPGCRNAAPAGARGVLCHSRWRGNRP